MKTKSLIITSAALLVLGGTGYVYYRYKAALGSVAAAFEPVEVKRGDIVVKIQATGVVQPENRLIIKPPINGRIDAVFVVEGQVVAKGQKLATMSSTDRAALLDAARSKGPSEVKHWEDIYRPTPVVAPMKGVVIARVTEPGQTISTQDTLFVLSDRLLIVAQVDETDMAKVHLGRQALITLDAYPEKEIQGRVHHIAFEAKTVNNVTVYDVDVLPAENPDFMRSGMTASVDFTLEERRDVLKLPVAAIRTQGQQAEVLMESTPDARGRLPPPAAHAIQTGLTDGKEVEVVSGLHEGDIVLQDQVLIPDVAAGSSPFTPFRATRPGTTRQRAQ